MRRPLRPARRPIARRGSGAAREFAEWPRW
jgi:hypothetical protein